MDEVNVHDGNFFNIRKSSQKPNASQQLQHRGGKLRKSPWMNFGRNSISHLEKGRGRDNPLSHSTSFMQSAQPFCGGPGAPNDPFVKYTDSVSLLGSNKRLSQYVSRKAFLSKDRILEKLRKQISAKEQIIK